ncbi:MAG: response regulator [bacterium]|nr:response regulator [bacterium]
MTASSFEILLVEDNPDHAELVIRSFEDHPVASKIHHLSDGEAAIDYLLRKDSDDKRAYSRPNIVLLDLRLPKRDGLDVLKEIRANKDLDEMPVVVLTTSSAESDVRKAYEHHANSYLVKPHDFTTFTKLMQDLGFYWLGWNHYPGQSLQTLSLGAAHRAMDRTRNDDDQ